MALWVLPLANRFEFRQSPVVVVDLAPLVVLFRPGLSPGLFRVRFCSEKLVKQN